MSKYTLSVTFETSADLTEADVVRLHRRTFDALDRQLESAGFIEDEEGVHVERIEVSDAEKVF